jgi:hypothetical protein
MEEQNHFTGREHLFFLHPDDWIPGNLYKKFLWDDTFHGWFLPNNLYQLEKNDLSSAAIIRETISKVNSGNDDKDFTGR